MRVGVGTPTPEPWEGLITQQVSGIEMELVAEELICHRLGDWMGHVSPSDPEEHLWDWSESGYKRAKGDG